ncbi:hypothetical protein C922_05329 [Plasmodium inui San Antonio 1]|uniref:Uncharacterized protein n=1 Tax=Plasmodium inui San Antonio 1 TaxID=1237626 RepID=W7A5A5_9APIC|nr:hypothetical protein C922_05329 [Plasmodium inui San Antonio 1]EUD64284.1 hypothetical protein C922_05329 [Plasmodium inui San Antonio 1]
MNNETSFLREMLDGNDTQVTTFAPNSTPLATIIDSFTSKGERNQVSTTATSPIVESVVNGVNDAITGVVGIVTSSFSGNESSPLQSLSAAHTQSVPIIHNGTNSSTTHNVLLGGSSQEICLTLNMFTLLFLFLLLLMIMRIAAFLYDDTVLGNCYDKVCDFLCTKPGNEEHDNADENETGNDIERGGSGRGARNKNSHRRDSEKRIRTGKKSLGKRKIHIFLKILLLPNQVYNSLTLPLVVMELGISCLIPHYMIPISRHLRTLKEKRIKIEMGTTRLLLSEKIIKEMLLLRRWAK